MPVITLEMAPLAIERKRELARELTSSASKITDLPRESFYVFIKENSLDNVGVGGDCFPTNGKRTDAPVHCQAGRMEGSGFHAEARTLGGKV